MTLHQEFPILQQIQEATREASATNPNISVSVGKGTFNIVDSAATGRGPYVNTYIERGIPASKIVARLRHYAAHPYTIGGNA